jgi:hypothetical protein
MAGLSNGVNCRPGNSRWLKDSIPQRAGFESLALDLFFIKTLVILHLWLLTNLIFVVIFL